MRPTRAPPGPSSLDGCLLALIRHASSFPAGTFVFVVSDFIDAVSPSIWLKLRALRWDVTPVVIQDPTWEQSFPDVGGVLLPVRDAASGDVGEVMVSGREARDAGARRTSIASSRCWASSRGSGSTRSCSAAASRRRSPRASTGGRAGAGGCGGGAHEARRRCDRDARARRSAVGQCGVAPDRRPRRPGEPSLRRLVRVCRHRDRRRIARRQRPHRERRRAVHTGRADGRAAVGRERRRPHHRVGDDRVPRPPPASRGRVEQPSRCRVPASLRAARSPSRPGSRSRLGLA